MDIEQDKNIRQDGDLERTGTFSTEVELGGQNDSGKSPVIVEKVPAKGSNCRIFLITTIIFVVLFLVSSAVAVWSFVQNNSDSGITGTTSSGDSASSAQVLANVSQNLTLSGHKCLNGDNLGGPSLSPAVLSEAVKISGPYGDSKEWTVVIDWDEVNRVYSLDNGKTGVEWLQNIDLGLDGEVIDAYATGFGQAFGFETFFFLMKDGTVEYLPVFKALKTDNLKSYGKLSGIKQVIKFLGANGDAGAVAAALRADGDYYNLYDAIISTDAY